MQQKLYSTTHIVRYERGSILCHLYIAQSSNWIYKNCFLLFKCTNSVPTLYCINIIGCYVTHPLTPTPVVVKLSCHFIQWKCVILFYFVFKIRLFSFTILDMRSMQEELELQLFLLACWALCAVASFWTRHIDLSK